jgi:hypothetical protein
MKECKEKLLEPCSHKDSSDKKTPHRGGAFLESFEAKLYSIKN